MRSSRSAVSINQVVRVHLPLAIRTQTETDNLRDETRLYDELP
jgi:hypothetical protein